MMRVLLLGWSVGVLVQQLPTALALPAAQVLRSRELTATIIRFALIDADSDQEIMDLNDGTVVTLSALRTKNLNVIAVPTRNVDSIQFDYDGKINYMNEWIAPYALCENLDGRFNPCPRQVFRLGSHTLTATGKRNGDHVVDRTISFTVVNSAVPNPPRAAPVPAPTTSPLPWVETFSDLRNGAQTDTGTTAWTTSRRGGTFAVQDKALVITGGGAEGVFQTEAVDISRFTSVSVSVQVRSRGRLNADQEYVGLYVIIDNGRHEQLAGKVYGVQDKVTTLTGKFSGHTIRLVIRALVTFEAESYTFDNVSVVAA
jgi:hypothetical protein